MFNTLSPGVIYEDALAANKAAAFLETMEEDGWTYEVITSPVSGRSFIAVHDENGTFVGNL